ncbi:MAG: glycosyltransferase family 2 protein [Leptolyngbyaceae cyanobacterium SL_1_1]|nr:glycosyltransferase family 2 protein [Leptolyngbyaceae cyanobacterium RM1_1_2]NJO08333.1 glycosyltransferase family 2 protein [Leptolyngbyaceae cyanobacterium SL_1_1]
METAERISVIIPLLNEVAVLPTTLAAIPCSPQIEIVGVDGGSQDETVSLARRLGVHVIETDPGRYHQLNQGAEVATGKILLFLHADTRLPGGFADLIRETLAQPGVVGGAFRLKINADLKGIRLVEWGVQARSRLFHLPYGDQALFVYKTTFEQLGGFAAMPIMEDYEFVRRLARCGKILIVSAAVITSGRRWQHLGVWQTTLLNQLIILAYAVGISPRRLVRWYRRGVNTKK